MYREIDIRILRQIGESHVFRVPSPFTPIRSTRRHSNFPSRGIPTTGWVWADFESKGRDFRRDFVFRGSPRSNDPCPPRTSRLSVAEEVLVPYRGSSRGPALKTEVVHNIVAVGSTTPPPPLPTFFSLSRPPSRAPARQTLSSIKAEGIDGEMIEHCVPQCSSMYEPALRAQSEYVVHRSNWTMIDDVTFPLSSPPPRLHTLSQSSSLSHFER